MRTWRRHPFLVVASRNGNSDAELEIYVATLTRGDCPAPRQRTSKARVTCRGRLFVLVRIRSSSSANHIARHTPHLSIPFVSFSSQVSRHPTCVSSNTTMKADAHERMESVIIRPPRSLERNEPINTNKHSTNRPTAQTSTRHQKRRVYTRRTFR